MVLFFFILFFLGGFLWWIGPHEKSEKHVSREQSLQYVHLWFRRQVTYSCWGGSSFSDWGGGGGAEVQDKKKAP